MGVRAAARGDPRGHHRARPADHGNRHLRLAGHQPHPRCGRRCAGCRPRGCWKHAPGGGLSVAIYDQRAIAEFYAVRESLEGTAAALAAQHADATERGLLRAIMEGMQALPDDPRAHARENEAFHEHIYGAAHNRFLLKSPAGAAELRTAAGPHHLPRARPRRDRPGRAPGDRRRHPGRRPGAGRGGGAAAYPQRAGQPHAGGGGGCPRRRPASRWPTAADRPERTPPPRGGVGERDRPPA